MTDEFYNNNNQQETENYEGNEQYSEGTATVDNEEPVTDTSNTENYYTVPVEPVNTAYTEDGKNKQKHKGKIAFVVACAILFGVVAGAVTAVTNTGVSKFIGSNVKIKNTESMLTASEQEEKTESAIADITEECMPSIVSITNKGVTEIMTFFGRYSQESTSSGSGIIIGKNDTELLIVTNYHVVADSKELSVIFANQESDDMAEGIDPNSTEAKNILQAQIKGYDSDKDLAVISIKLSEIPADMLSQIKVATIGNSSNIRAGERVIAIGNALGYGTSVTTGIISATRRAVQLESQSGTGETVSNYFIQTDAAINPGNSGGALLNMRGELIGINSVKIAANGVEGMGYAIPISDVESIIGELMVRETREVVDEDSQGFLGITGEDIASQISQTYGISGVFVTSVTKGSAADKAGIKKGYVITKFDGYTVKSISELQNRLTYYKAGETKTITVKVNNGSEYEEKELTITLDNKKKSLAKAEKEGWQDNQQEDKEDREDD
ncbi:MAG: trypsin-like peptidase domain-containing protein [Clostridia bacterium]|nr:trypsin-like peptidase domain-containing protein [Clostridia bacterium]